MYIYIRVSVVYIQESAQCHIDRAYIYIYIYIYI